MLTKISCEHAASKIWKNMSQLTEKAKGAFTPFNVSNIFPLPSGNYEKDKSTWICNKKLISGPLPILVEIWDPDSDFKVTYLAVYNFLRPTCSWKRWRLKLCKFFSGSDWSLQQRTRCEKADIWKIVELRKLTPRENEATWTATGRFPYIALKWK